MTCCTWKYLLPTLSKHRGLLLGCCCLLLLTSCDFAGMDCALADAELVALQRTWEEVRARSGQRDSVLLQHCRELERLARRCPERFADYIVAANSFASTCFSHSFAEWEDYLSRGEETGRVLADYLSDSLALRTTTLIRYERCRKEEIMGNADEALSCYQEVWESLPATHHDEQLLSAFRYAVPISIVHLYQSAGAYDKASDWIVELQEYLTDDPSLYSGLYYNLQAKMYEMADQLGRARGSYLQAIEQYRGSAEARRAHHFAENFIHFSNFYLKQGQLDSALLVMEEAMSYGPYSGWSQVYVAYQRSRLLTARSQPAAAAGEGRRALQAIDILIEGKNYWKARALGAIGEAEAGREHYPQALDYLQEGLRQLTAQPLSRGWNDNPHPRSSDTKLELLKLLVAKADILRRYYRSGEARDQWLLRSAASTYRVIIELIRILRAEYESDEVKEYLSQSTFATFEAALHTAAELYRLTGASSYLQEAFAVSETSKALSLYEQLKTMEAEAAADLPPRLVDRERSLKYKIAGLEMSLRESKGGQTRRDLLQLLVETRREYRELIRSLEQGYPTYYNLKYRISAPDLATIRDELAPDETMVAYFYGDEHIYAFVIDRGGVRLHRMERTEAMEQHLIEVADQVSRPGQFDSYGDIRRYLQHGYAVYRQFFADLSLTGRKIIVIPDGRLNDIPFAALPTDTLLVDDPRRLPYLLQRHLLRRNFSASVWRQQRLLDNRRRQATGKLLVIAPERFPNNSRLELDRRTLEQLFGEAVVFVTNPGKEEVRELFGRNFDNIFIFTHASGSADQPYLQLFDDFLFLPELYATRISANLVLLSACETGIGKLRRGEGVLSLGRGFAYQNVPHTVMTLWKVNELAALKLSTRLLNFHLTEGLTPAEALRKAQLDLLADPELDGSPFSWAGFICSGK